jgi:uncharacterized protein (TIGR02284 family)
MSAAHDVRVLNDLTRTILDSAHGHDEALKDAPEGQADAYRAGAAERRVAAQALQAEVARLGGDPEDDGGLLAAAHRVLMNVRDQLGGERALVDEMLRGEAVLKARFQSALDDDRLTGEVRDAVLRAYDAVKPGHDRLIQLKAALEGAA